MQQRTHTMFMLLSLFVGLLSLPKAFAADSAPTWRQACVDSSLLARWDQDRDGALAEAEIASGLFRHWDDDNDGLLEAREWRQVPAGWRAAYTPALQAADVDADGELEYRPPASALSASAHSLARQPGRAWNAGPRSRATASSGARGSALIRDQHSLCERLHAQAHDVSDGQARLDEEAWLWRH